MAGVLASIIDVPPQGRVFPRGWRLALAIVAGAAWVFGVGGIASVVLESYHRAPLPNLPAFGLSLLLVAVAQVLSIAAHGDASGAPALVRTVRFATWLGILGVFALPLVSFALGSH